MLAKPTISPKSSRAFLQSRFPCQFLLRNLVLVANSLSRLRSPGRLPDTVSHRFSSSLLESLGIIHLDLLSTNTVFGFLLVLAISETKGIIVSIANGAWVNSRQWLPLALLPQWQSISLSRGNLWGVAININLLWRTTLE